MKGCFDMYLKPEVEVIEFSNEEVVMNLVASSDDPTRIPVQPVPPVVTPPQPRLPYPYVEDVPDF